MKRSDCLNGWKEIAQYLDRGVRTIQRWEKVYALPIHRPAGKDRAAVFALQDELDEWRTNAWKHADSDDPAILRLRLQQLESEVRRIRATLNRLEVRTPLDVRPKTIMAVDDNEAFRYTITKVVERGGHTPIEAMNGTQALALAKKHLPDLILLDVNMPDLPGYEVCRLLKEDPATSHIPVVFLSATDRNPSAIERAIAAGAESFLFAPVEPEQLMAVVHGALVKKALIKH